MSIDILPVKDFLFNSSLYAFRSSMQAWIASTHIRRSWMSLHWKWTVLSCDTSEDCQATIREILCAIVRITGPEKPQRKTSRQE